MKRTVWPIAWSFAEWTCCECRQKVHWVDAIVIDETDVFKVVHADCLEDPCPVTVNVNGELL